jgi:uncharacterized protein YbaA (DUF1428 family)
MKYFSLLFLFFTALVLGCRTSPQTTTSDASAAATPVKDTRFYEMRIYYSPPGKLADLHARFRNHTTRFFEKHSMTNIGYWEPVDNTDNKIIYILAYPSKEARNASWKTFGADPEWQAVAKASEVNGRIVSKVETWYLEATDYSPVIKPAAGQSRFFEMRTYTASPNNTENLHARFREHTTKLFEKHGMTNIAYWRPIDKDSDKSNVLLYIMAYPSKEAQAASWQAFRSDPVWVAARKASEEKGGGSLTTKVESVFMKATDYSPIQ